MIHWELWLRSQGTVKKFNSTTGAVKSLEVPWGYCFKYHKGSHCSGCSFKHSCSKCDGPHRAVNCNFRAYGKKGSSNFPNQQNDKPSSSQNPPQPTSTGASNARKQWSFAIFSFCLYASSSPAFIPWLQLCFFFLFLHYEGPQDSSCAKNLLSAILNPEPVDAKIDKELVAQRLAGPFSSPPFSHFRISPLGLVPKKTEGEFRLIHHLCFPQGSSLNDGISSEFASVSYATVDDAIRTIKTVGQGWVARSIVSASHWLRRIKTYRLLWYLTGRVSASHASSNWAPGCFMAKTDIIIISSGIAAYFAG